MNKTDIEDRTAHIVEDIKATVNGLAGDARHRAKEVTNQATRTADRAYAQVREVATAATATVEKQPLVALMAVGLVAGVVGFLLARR